jgi:MSHA biogenesis protein MshJ
MKASLKNWLIKIRDRLDALQPRERNIVLILSLVVVAFLWDQLCYSPLQRSAAQASEKITTVTNQLTTAGNKLSALAQPGSNPAGVLRDRQQQLKIAIKQLDGTIEQLTGNLIPAKKMVQVLEDVLHQSSSLQLIKVKNLPVRKLMVAGVAENLVDETSGVYLHAVELELRGSYFETLAYLRALESLPWQVIWDQLQYRVDDYPQAVIRLRINTLSASAGLLGV